MLRNETTYELGRGLAYQQVGGEVFAVTVDNRLHDLRDVVGLFIFSLLVERPRGFVEIVTACVDEFDVEPNVAWEQIVAFLRDGVKKGIFLAHESQKTTENESI